MAATIASKRIQEFKARYKRHSSSFHDKYAALFGLFAIHGLGRHSREWGEKALQEMRLEYLAPEAQRELDELEEKNQRAKDRLAKREQERAENVAAGRPKNQSRAEAKRIERQPVASAPPSPEEDPWKDLTPSK
jgi:hypothetical protein